MSKKLIKITITGPESSGKTTIAEALAQHYNTLQVPEFAREYLSQINRNYEEGDLLRIAKGQMAFEDAAASLANRVLICDTDLLVLKIWSLHAYGKCDMWILREMKNRRYAHRFLTRPDIPWKPDPLREHPNLRQYLFDWYLRELNDYKEPFTILEGSHEERMDSATKVIDRLLKDYQPIDKNNP